MRGVFLAAIVIGLTSCASEVYLPDGRKGYTIDCGGWALTWGQCLQKAGDLCRERGYDIYERSAATGQITAVAANAYSGSGYSGPFFQREMLIGCKG